MKAAPRCRDLARSLERFVPVLRERWGYQTGSFNGQPTLFSGVQRLPGDEQGGTGVIVSPDDGGDQALRRCNVRLGMGALERGMGLQLKILEVSV